MPDPQVDHEHEESDRDTEFHRAIAHIRARLLVAATARCRYVDADPAIEPSDLVHDLLIDIQEGRVQLPLAPLDGMIAFLVGVLNNRIRRAGRDQARRRRLDLTRGLRPWRPPDPHEIAVHAELRERLTQRINMLTTAEREVLKSVAMEGLTPREVAECRGGSASTVRELLRRARAKLRSQTGT